MNAKEKAKELLDRFARIDGYQDSIDLSKCEYEKQCALIAVDEIIKANPIIPLQFMLESEAIDEAILYWQDVKSEIEKLV